MSIINTKQINSPLNITGSLFGTASWATNVVNGSNIDLSSYVTTSSYNAFTSSVLTTSSFNSWTGSTNSRFSGTSSFATTSSHALNGGVTAITAGTGISRDTATGNVTITNTAPDQVVSLTNGGSISITGTYPSFTIQNTAPFPGFGYSQLLYIFSQEGGNAPSYAFSLNTTEANFTFKRQGTGYYQLKAEGGATPFTANLTAVYLTPGYTVGTFDNSNRFAVWFEIINTSTINIYSYDVGANAPTDDVFNQATLDIKIF